MNYKMTDIVKEIINVIAKENDKLIYIYPKCNIDKYKITPYLFDNKEIEKLKSILNSNSNVSLVQEETYFRDLLKIKIESTSTTISYFKKSTTYSIFNDLLLVKNKTVKISEDNYPKLSKYHHSEIKNIEILNWFSIEINIIKNNDKYNIYLFVDVLNKKKAYNDVTKFMSILEEIQSIN